MVRTSTFEVNVRSWPTQRRFFVEDRPFFALPFSLPFFATFFYACLLLCPFFGLSFGTSWAVGLVSSSMLQVLQVAGSRFQVHRSVVRSILITLIKVLPSLVFFTPFLTNYAGISCFRFCFCSFSLLFAVVAVIWIPDRRSSGLNSCSSLLL